MVLAQAAARAFPDRYRLLGGTITEPPTPAVPRGPADAVDAYRERKGLSWATC